MKALKLIMGLLVVLLVAVGCVSEGNTVNTNGQATIEVDPDEAVVYVSVETLKDTAQASKNKNSEITDHVYTEMYKIGIDRDNIESAQYNLYEDFDWINGKRKSKGFKTVHVLKITSEEFDDVGEIVDAVIDVGEGMTRINNINFELSDAQEREFKKQALTEATQNAKDKAEAMAEGLDAELGALVSISDATYDYRLYPLYEAAMGVAALEKTVGTQISPQQLEVRANVQVVYRIK